MGLTGLATITLYKLAFTGFKHGAGIAGLSTAYLLACEGRRVVVLDEADEMLDLGFRGVLAVAKGGKFRAVHPRDDDPGRPPPVLVGTADADVDE